MEKKLHQWISRPSLCRAYVCVCVCAHVWLSVCGVIYAQNYLLGCKLHREIKVNKKQ